jgi:signal transduction histidine kinase
MEGFAVTPTAARTGRLLLTGGRLLLGLLVLVLSYLARPPYGFVDLALGPDSPAAGPVSPDGKSVIVNQVTPGLDVTAFVVATACALAVVMARHRQWPLYVAAFGGWMLFAMWPAIVVASYCTATTVRRRAELVSYAAAASVMVLVITAYPAIDRRADVLLLGFALEATCVALPIVAGLWVQARRDVRGGAREWAAGRERMQTALYEQARAQERARIAREMHDVVAHRVSLIVLQAGALEVSATDQRCAEAAALIRGIGREALTDLREVLGVLRSPDAEREPQPTLADLADLIGESRSLGMPVERRDEGEPRPLPPTVERAAYRVVQEALTNVRKHAGNAATTVVVRYLPDALEVVVDNAPPRHTMDPVPGSALGLAGLRERIELLGGRFEASPSVDGGGFTVRAILPAAPEHSP